MSFIAADKDELFPYQTGEHPMARSFLDCLSLQRLRINHMELVTFAPREHQHLIRRGLLVLGISNLTSSGYKWADPVRDAGALDHVSMFAEQRFEFLLITEEFLGLLFGDCGLGEGRFWLLDANDVLFFAGYLLPEVGNDSLFVILWTFALSFAVIILGKASFITLFWKVSLDRWPIKVRLGRSFADSAAFAGKLSLRFLRIYSGQNVRFE